VQEAATVIVWVEAINGNCMLHKRGYHAYIFYHFHALSKNIIYFITNEQSKRVNTKDKENIY